MTSSVFEKEKDKTQTNKKPGNKNTAVTPGNAMVDREVNAISLPKLDPLALRKRSGDATHKRTVPFCYRTGKQIFRSTKINGY